MRKVNIVDSHAGGHALTDCCGRVWQAVNAQGYPEVDRVELSDPPTQPGVQSRNFVQCPGKAYDHSPCEAGTSAKLACLAADGKLLPSETYVPESLNGSTFAGKFAWLDQDAGKIAPVTPGTAFVNAEATQWLDDKDSVCWGIR